jgi:endonuclease-3 related protein
MPSFDASYAEIIAALLGRYGRLESGPRPPDLLRRLLAVLLSQTIAPRNVSRLLDALHDAGMLEPAELAEAEAFHLAELAESGGTPLSRPAAQTLKRVARWLVERHNGSVESLEDAPTDQLREELLALNGIGPASADAILLFALGRPVYPVDRASYRILARHEWLDVDAGYEEARDVIERPASGDLEALVALSAWSERIGRDFCRRSVARCEQCPLKPFLPAGGPRAPE